MSEPMCKEIKRRGYKLFLTDGNTDCYCRPLADQFHQVSVYDVATNLDLGRILLDLDDVMPHEIAAVLTINTDAGPTVSALAEYFDLPGIGRDKAELVKDKIRMRQQLDWSHPYFSVHYIGMKPDNYYPVKCFPLVVKAPDQAGSRGFEIANNNPSLNRIIAARQFEGNLLLEQLLVGENIIPEWYDKYDFDTSEAAFDFFVEDGEVIYANGALRMFWADQPGIEAGHINPFEAIANAEDMELIMVMAQAAATGLGIDWGVLKIDAIRDQRYGWCLLECATRLSGGFDHMYTSPLATGRDVTGVMLDVALGQKVDRSKLENRKGKIACCLAPRYWSGPIDGWTIRSKGFDAQKIFPMTQDYIKPIESNQDRPLFIITVADTAAEALDKAWRVRRFAEPIEKADKSWTQR